MERCTPYSVETFTPIKSRPERPSYGYCQNSPCHPVAAAGSLPSSRHRPPVLGQYIADAPGIHSWHHSRHLHHHQIQVSTMAPATPHDYDAQLAHLERLADLLDSRWRIPGLGIPIGIDGIASIFPVVGDSATGIVSAYLVYQASRLGVPKSVLLRMVGNAG